MKTRISTQPALRTAHQITSRNTIAIRFTALAAILLSLTAMARAETIHVPGDFPEIQFAIIVAEDGDEVLVAPGTYTEQIDFLGKAITVQSTDGPAKTIIDAKGAGSVAKCVNGEGLDTVLDGFTITGGIGTIVGDNRRGGGMFNNNGSSPTIKNCTFTENSVTGTGGGMYNRGSITAVTNCKFIGNSAKWGGGMRNWNSAPTVIGCTFQDNTAEIRAGGMYNSHGQNPTVMDCTFTGNSAIVKAGGMYNNDSDPQVLACTFAGNATDGDGAGVYNTSSANPTIGASNFCENAPDHIFGNWIDKGDNCFANVCEQCFPCPPDFNDDGEVTVGDLLVLLAFWGTDGEGADLAEPNDVVTVSDLLELLAAWGPCE